MKEAEKKRKEFFRQACGTFLQDVIIVAKTRRQSQKFSLTRQEFFFLRRKPYLKKKASAVRVRGNILPGVSYMGTAGEL